MKKTLTLLALMIAVAGAGQTTRWQTFSPKQTITKYDTIPILYLYADTATFEAFGAKQRNPAAYWDFGYEVIEGRVLWRIGNDGSRTPLFNHITYLDRQKQPIRKSIVIFMSKTIEK